MNTSLVKLNLDGFIKKRESHKWYQTIFLVSYHFWFTGNAINDAGATSLGEALKKNTTLTKLGLNCKQQEMINHLSGFFFNLSSPINRLIEQRILLVAQDWNHSVKAGNATQHSQYWIWRVWKQIEQFLYRFMYSLSLFHLSLSNK